MLKNLKIWTYFRHVIADDALQSIAEADYGFNIKEHLSALTNILSTGTLPKELEWEPREALGLTRWHDYSANDTLSIQKVFFSTFVLLAASENKESADLLDGQIENMILAIDCASLLGSEEVEMLHEFFMTIIASLDVSDQEEDYLYFYVSCVLLSAMLNIPSADMDVLIDNTIKAEEDVAKYCGDELQNNIFAYTCFDQKISLWHKYYHQYGEALEKRRRSYFTLIWEKNS